MRAFVAAFGILVGMSLAAPARAQVTVLPAANCACTTAAPYTASYLPTTTYYSASAPTYAAYAAPTVAYYPSTAVYAAPTTVSYAASYSPTTAYYPTTTYYAPTTAYYAPAAVAAPVYTTYYAPAVVAPTAVVGSSVFGSPTIYVPGQPVRNALRALRP